MQFLKSRKIIIHKGHFMLEASFFNMGERGRFESLKKQPIPLMIKILIREEGRGRGDGVEEYLKFLFFLFIFTGSSLSWGRGIPPFIIFFYV